MMLLRQFAFLGFLAFAMFSCETPAEEVVELDEPTPEVEKITETYANGYVKLRGTLIDGKRSGLWESFYDNGYRWSEMEYYKGMRDGNVVSYFPNGMMRYQGRYASDNRVGFWMFYDTTGVLLERIDMDEFSKGLDTLNHGMKLR